MPFLAILVAFSMNSCKHTDPNDDEETYLQSLVPKGWTVQIVDTATDCVIGDYNKIAVDKNKGVHILYSFENQDGDASLKYAYKPDGGNWTTETITTPDGVLMDLIDLAVSSNKVYVVYQDSWTQQRIHLATKTIGSSSWTDDIIDDKYEARYPNLFINDKDVVFISYTHANEGEYFEIVGGTQQKITDKGDNPTDIVVDKDGVVHIFYTHENELHHIYSNNYTDWTDEVIYTDANNGLQRPDASVDADGNISVALTLDYISNGCKFFYKKYGDTTFSTSTPFNSKFSNGLMNTAVDLSGNQYFTAYSTNDECIFLADKEKDKTDWNTTLLLKSNEYGYGLTNDIVIDKDYGIHISSNGAGLYYLYKEKK